MKMKKSIIAGVLACLVAIPAMAQPGDKEKNKNKEEVEVEIDGSKVTIKAEDLEGLSTVDLNTIVREVTKRAVKIQQQQRELLAQVDKQEANGDITEEQADEMRDMINERTEESMEMIGELMEAWGESYEARMETWEDQYEAEMEAWEAEVEARAKKGGAFVMPPLPPMPPMPPMAEGESSKKGQKIIINEDGIIIRRGEDGEEPFALRFEEDDDDQDIDIDEDYEDNGSERKRKIDRTNGYLDINWGFNQQLANGTDFITTGDDELNFFNSTEFNLGFGGKTRIGSPYSKLYIRYGAEFSWHRFRLFPNNILMQDAANERVVIAEDTMMRNIEKSSYHIAYFNVPVMLQLDFSEVGDIDESFTLGVGGYAGVRLGAKRKLDYSTPVIESAEERAKDEFYTQQIRYGVMAQVGFDAFKITAKYDLNEFFKENAGPTYQMASITIGFTL